LSGVVINPDIAPGFLKHRNISFPSGWFLFKSG
jgi:hypothetical protein